MPSESPMPSENTNANADWLKLDDALKKYALAIIIIGSIGITLLLGPQALYFVIGVGAIATFAVYPDIDPEYSLWGSLFGAMYAGPLGLLAGGILGYYLGQKYEKTLKAINTVAAPVHTVLNIPSQIKNGIKSIGNGFVNGFSRAHQGARQFFENEADNLANLPVNPAPVAPIQGSPPKATAPELVVKEMTVPTSPRITSVVDTQVNASQKITATHPKHKKATTDMPVQTISEPRMTRAQARTAKAKASKQTKIKSKSSEHVMATPPAVTLAPVEPPTSPGALKRTLNMFANVWDAANQFYEKELDIYNDVQENASAPLVFSQQVNNQAQAVESPPANTSKRRSRFPMTLM